MADKTTRAFRTISEAGEELGLQPHVLRFWESKFPQIKPIKRGGGRRFYRPEDIELLRGIKILLHDEKHPIKDVQKLIRVKGVQRVLDVGRAAEAAAPTPDIADVVLVPDRIRRNKKQKSMLPIPKAPTEAVFDEVIADIEVEHGDISDDDRVVPLHPGEEPAADTDFDIPADDMEAYTIPDPDLVTEEVSVGLSDAQREEMGASLDRLKALKARWQALMSTDPSE